MNNKEMIVGGAIRALQMTEKVILCNFCVNCSSYNTNLSKTVLKIIFMVYYENKVCALLSLPFVELGSIKRKYRSLFISRASK